MSDAPPDPLVSTDWLAEHRKDPDVRIVDSSWYLPAMQRDGRAEYEAAHIPRTVFWDIETVADTTSGLPHMMPTPEDFARHMSAMGIGDETTVVVYDGIGLFTAARPWWMLRAFGHDKVVILDGGLPKWMAEGRPVTDRPPLQRTATFTPRPRPGLIRNIEAIIENLDSGHEQVVDARSEARFTGREPEPRPNLRSGHIPHSRNLPYNHLIDPQTRTVLPLHCLRNRFAGVGIDLNRPVVASCGSGVSACIVALALYLIGKTDAAVYDGSWTEWASRSDTPIEVNVPA
jgi:thiosulfate/3-mercaptopyruvate sulfurtransferase